MTYEIDFTHPVIGRQRLDLEVTPEVYAREISFSRTFGFYREVRQLLENNLIRGGSFENAVVLSDDGVMSGELRAPDEFVRHKVLDLIGDVSLCGSPVIGHVRAYKAGHALHTALATALFRNASRWQCRRTGVGGGGGECSPPADPKSRRTPSTIIVPDAVPTALRFWDFRGESERLFPYPWPQTA